jgi:hypothetical protein
MGKWLAKFSADNQELQPDIPDILDSVSDLSGSFSICDEENSPQSHPRWPPLVSDDSVIEPAAPKARSVYWEKADTSIWGPATPLFLARFGNTFVLIVDFEGDLISINSPALRPKRQFDSQVKPKIVNLIRDPWEQR